MKACFVSFYSDCFPGVAIGVKVARRDNEFGWRAAVWTLLVHVGKRKFFGHALLPSPAPNALQKINERKGMENTFMVAYTDTEYMTTVN